MPRPATQPEATQTMSSFNKVILMGNITRDPEMRYTPKGTPVAAIGIAVNRKWKDESGQLKEDVAFIDLVSYGKQAETIVQYFKKGSPILVEGRLAQERWTDKDTGSAKSKTRVVIETFQFVGGPRQPSPATQAAPPTDAPAEQASEDLPPF